MNSIKNKVTEWNQHQQKLNTPRTKNQHSMPVSKILVEASNGDKSQDNEEGKKKDHDLENLISAFTSPVPEHIFTDYENKSKKKSVI